MGVDKNCTNRDDNEWPRSHHFLSSLAAEEQAMVGICSCLCFVNIVIFIDNTYFVWSKNVNMKRTVLATVWMIGLTPALSLIALLGMMTPRIYIFQDMLTILCIAVVMYKFVHLIIAYGRFYEKIMENVRTKRIRFNLGPCCCCCFCLPTAAINRTNANKVKWMILQYPILSTAITVLTMVTWLNENYKQGEWEYDNPYPYLTTVRVVSVLVALHGLNVIVTPCLDAMKSLLIRPKFLSLRLSMMLYAIQGIVFDSLVQFTDLFDIRACLSEEVMGNFYQNLVFCIEMFLLTMLNFWSYRRILLPADEKDDIEGPGSEAIGDVGDCDIIKDLDMELQVGLEEIFNEKEGKQNVHNLGKEVTQSENKDIRKNSIENGHTKLTKDESKTSKKNWADNPVDTLEGED